jgi:hypothetical protein
MTNFSAYISLLSFFNDYVTNLNSKKIQIGNNIDEILYDHDGIKMKELLFVSRIIYPLLNKANHVKVEAHMAPPFPLTSLSIDPQNPIYKI